MSKANEEAKQVPINGSKFYGPRPHLRLRLPRPRHYHPTPTRRNSKLEKGIILMNFFFHERTDGQIDGWTKAQFRRGGGDRKVVVQALM